MLLALALLAALGAPAAQAAPLHAPTRVATEGADQATMAVATSAQAFAAVPTEARGAGEEYSVGLGSAVQRLLDGDNTEIPVPTDVLVRTFDATTEATATSVWVGQEAAVRVAVTASDELYLTFRSLMWNAQEGIDALVGAGFATQRAADAALDDGGAATQRLARALGATQSTVVQGALASYNAELAPAAAGACDAVLDAVALPPACAPLLT